MFRPTTLLLALVLLLPAPDAASAQNPQATPLRQSELDGAAAVVAPLTLRDASRNDRWLGLGVQDVRWAPDGTGVYFRWNQRPQSDDVPQEDPWFFVDETGAEATQLPLESSGAVPSADMRWSPDGTLATWVSDGGLWIYGSQGGLGRW